MTPTIYFNGAFVAPQEAAVNVSDGGFLHGAGLFETLRAQAGRIFRLESHLERLRRSAARLLVPLKRDDLPSADVFHELLERNGLPQARVRLTVTAGSMRDETENEEGHLTVCVTATELSPYPAGHYERGVQVAVCDFRQSSSDPVAGHKTTSYLPRLLGLRTAHAKRCVEAIWFTTQNRLAEGSISNVFVVRDGCLKTPPLDTPVLPGITRGVVLELAEAADEPVEQTLLGVHDLLDADEVFLTNAVMQVMPVIRVERHDIADAKVGVITRRFREAYLDLVNEECGTP